MATLYKTGGGKTPRRVIQLAAPDGTRPTIHLGRVNYAYARQFKTMVESLASARWMNVAPDPAVSVWVGGLSDEMHEKLHKAGLVDPREPADPVPTAPTLGEWVKRYLESRPDLKPKCRKSIERTGELLKEHFSDHLPIDAITPGAAADWRAWLIGKKMSEASVRHHIRNAKTMFTNAADRELVQRNPFRKLPSRSIAAERTRYVTPVEAEKILEHCPNVQWKALFGLARLAGLRVPSETHALEWSSIDFERGRMIVKSPKTERFEGKSARVVPIVPRLQVILQSALLDEGTDPEKVINLGLNNLHRNFQVIVKRAGLVPWPDLFQTLRRSCETEWSETYPAHAAAAWIGHSQKVSREHYLMVPDHLFDAAAGIGQPDQEEPRKGAAKSAAKSVAECPRTSENDREQPNGPAAGEELENPDFAGFSEENDDASSRTRTLNPLIKRHTVQIHNANKNNDLWRSDDIN